MLVRRWERGRFDSGVWSNPRRTAGAGIAASCAELIQIARRQVSMPAKGQKVWPIDLTWC